ncbi:MAG: hypothetical protein IJ157_09970 [Clostridia bacterium]|nr:hypothetical protein [Clostridia bacterium]
MKIGVIHANPSAAAPLEDAFRQIDPSAKIVNFINPEMLRLVDEAGGVTDQALRLFVRTVFDAADAGVDGIIIGCSVFCAYVEQVKPFLSVPIIPVDGPALEIAAKRGGKVGILATTAASAPACRKKLDKIAQEQGIHLEYEDGICTEALDALRRGDGAEHDRLLAAEGKRLASLGCTTLFLSQITMARAKAAMGPLAEMTLTTPEEGAKAILILIRRSQSKSFVEAR